MVADGRVLASLDAEAQRMTLAKWQLEGDQLWR
jgi:hypothetical protein